MEPTRLFDVMARQATEHPRPDALATKVDGSWTTYSSRQVIETADLMSYGLSQLGVAKGDRVAIISMNRPEWSFADLGILQLGAVGVPIYPSATPTDYEFILAHAEVKVALVATKQIYDKLQAVRAKLPKLTAVYSFDRIPGVDHWSDLTEAGKRVADPVALVAAKARVTPGDLASLIYTSGTTGTPKGVMLTHANFMANIDAVAKIFPSTGIDRALSFLPLSHVFERTVSYFYQYASVGIYYAESIDTIGKNLQEVHPQIIVTVPRLLEKIYEGILAKGRELTGWKRHLFDWSLRLGEAYNPDKTQGPLEQLQLAVARKLIYSKWQTALGGQLKMVIVGGSALQPRLGRIFWAAGLMVMEGYGLTETAPVIAVNTPTQHRIGTVGKVLPNVQVRIQPEEGYQPGEGEILVKGPSVMAGYYRNPEATKESQGADGWFHTGDIGMLADGFLKITDRKKEMFKTSGGKYVAPLVLENKFLESPYIGQVMVVGENRKFPAALIVPEAAAVQRWCQDHGVPWRDLGEAAQEDRVRDLFSEEVRRLNEGFGQWERIKQFRLLTDVWSIDSGEMTPKMSLKRKVIQAKYKDLIDGMYGGSASGD